MTVDTRKDAVSKVPPTLKNQEDEPSFEEIQFPPPMVETFIHNANFEVQQVPTPTGLFTLLRFHTPTMVYTIRLDEGGVEAILNAMGGSGASRILIAGENEIPNLRG
jgi:hypothetical protein